MQAYVKHFERPYPDGYKNRPDMTTLVTAAILNMQDATFEALENYLVQLEIPSKMSDLNNDSGFITKMVSNLANYYTKAAVDNLIERVSGNLKDEIGDIVQTAIANKADILIAAYPVGSIYMNTDNDENPAAFLGGTWESCGTMTVGTDTQCYVWKRTGGESASEPLIPVMTNNTTPSGVVSASYTYPGRGAWYAFSGSEPNVNNGFGYWYCQPAEGWLQYDFQKTITAEKISFVLGGDTAKNPYTVSIQSSLDGENFETIATVEYDAQRLQYVEYDADLNGAELRYFRLKADKGDFSCGKVQMYGIQNQ